MTNFGSGEHDDCVDAFVLLVKALVGTGRLQPAWGEWRDGD